MKEAIDRKSCNALLLKVNQIGSVTESIEACKMAQGAGWGVMVSHRSGETEDNFIADLVVGLCTGQVRLHLCLLLPLSNSQLGQRFCMYAYMQAVVTKHLEGTPHHLKTI